MNRIHKMHVKRTTQISWMFSLGWSEAWSFREMASSHEVISLSFQPPYLLSSTYLPARYQGPHPCKLQPSPPSSLWFTLWNKCFMSTEHIILKHCFSDLHNTLQEGFNKVPILLVHTMAVFINNNEKLFACGCNFKRATVAGLNTITP